MSKDVLVIGAGLTGIAAAWSLRKKGFNVSVIDAHEGPALETSYANAGALTPSEPEPWNAPGVHWDLLKSLFDPHAAMKLRLAPLPGLIGWGMKFLFNSSRKRYEASARANFALSRYSLEQTRSVRDELGLEFDNLQAGTLKVFQSEDRMKAAAAAAEFLRDEGLEFSILDREATLSLEPQLASVADRIAGSIHYPMDESGDAQRFTAGLAAACEKAGVEFEWNSPVDALLDRAGRIIGIQTGEDEIHADEVVLATGHASWRLLKPHALHLPVRPVKGYSLTLDMSGLNARPGVPVVDDAMHAIVTPMGDRLRVAGTAEIAGENKTLSPERIENLKHLLIGIYPDLAPQLLDGEIQPWTGLRPMSADGRPFIGETRASGLWLTTGHGHLGWTQAMGSGALLADLIAGERPVIDASPFSAKRI
ncbi:MAG: FAD-dependent oxidoreductase [Alphaproteobacteria bacterium]|nr:FAD-dependent oxidoreductase [Alphaproteobacteria bacterium]